MQVYVEGMERVVMLGYEKKDLFFVSMSWIVVVDVKGKNLLMLNGIFLFCFLSIIQEDVLVIVIQVIDNFLEIVIRYGNQCNDEVLEEQMVKVGFQILFVGVNEVVVVVIIVMEG